MLAASTFASDLSNWLSEHDLIARLAGAGLVLFGSVVVVKVVNRAIQRAYWHRQEERAAKGQTSGLRGKRQQTVVTLLQSIIRYVVFGVAFLVALGLALNGLPSALFGASLAVVVVGFGVQRFLGDVVAGMLLLFENQYAVGDWVRILPHGVEGMVEEFNLRYTAVRAPNGDRVLVLNGTIQAVSTTPTGYRTTTLTFRAVDDTSQDEVQSAAERAVAHVGSGWGLVDQRPKVSMSPGHGSPRFRVTICTLPQTGDAVGEEVRMALQDELGERLAGEVALVDWDGGLLQRQAAAMQAATAEEPAAG